MRRTANILRPRSLRRIRDLHDAGGALKISPETVSVTLDSRKHTSHPQLGCLSNFSYTPVFALCVLCLLCVYSSGCAARKPIADHRQPPPAQASETPAETTDAAKRSTGVDASDLPSAPAPSTKRNKPAAAPAPSGYTEEGPGVVPVRVEVLGGVDPTAGFFTLQVGAFRDRANAERLRDSLNASYSPIFIQQYDSPDGVFYRVRVGRISGEDAARHFGEQLHDRDGFTPLVTRLDEDLPAGGNR